MPVPFFPQTAPFAAARFLSGVVNPALRRPWYDLLTAATRTHGGRHTHRMAAAVPSPSCRKQNTTAKLSIYFYKISAEGVVPDFCQITLHTVGVLMVNDVEKLSQLFANLRHLVVRVRVEQNLLQQIIVL